MNGYDPPKLDTRRESDFERELLERAHAWLPTWAGDEGIDFGRSLLRIAARFNAEIAERLDKSAEKMRRGFFDWLGVRGDAARPARMPVVFKMAARASRSVLALAPVRMQADAGDAAVVFESERDVRLMPARIEGVIAVDPGEDQYFEQSPGLTEIEPAEAAPSQWLVQGDFAPGAEKLQLDPEAGLEPGVVLAIGRHRYQVKEANQGLVTITPAVREEGIADGSVAERVTAFSPFDGEWLGRQEHALYLGDAELLNLEAEATIEVVGGQSLQGVTWQYWGKQGADEQPDWRDFDFDAQSQPNDAVRLTKGKGALDPLDLAGVKGARWLRAHTQRLAGGGAPPRVDRFALKINPRDPSREKIPDPATSPQADAFANTSPLALNAVFYPLGREPRLFDAFYLGCAEAFSKVSADVRLRFEIADPTVTSYSLVRTSGADPVIAGVGKDGALHLLQLDGNGSLAKFAGREPLQPPLPAFPGTEAAGPSPISLTRSTWRPPVWYSRPPPGTAEDAFIATVAGATVWVWHEKGTDQNASGWVSFGDVPADQPTDEIHELLILDNAAQQKLCALRGTKLSTRDVAPNAAWDGHSLAGLPPGVTLESLVPVVAEADLTWDDTQPLVALGSDGVLYEVTLGGAVSVFRASAARFDAGVTPVAIARAGGVTVMAVRADAPPAEPRLAAHPDAGATLESDPLGLNAEVKSSLDLSLTGGVLTVLAVVMAGGDAYLASWAPFAAAPGDGLFKMPVTPGAGLIGGPPTSVGSWVVVPGTRGDTLVATLDAGDRVELPLDVEPGIVVPESTQTLHAQDFVVTDHSGQADTIAESGKTRGGETLYPIAVAPMNGVPRELFDRSERRNGNFAALVAPDIAAVDLELGDHDVTQGMILWVEDWVYEVISVDRPGAGRWTAHLGAPAWVHALATYPATNVGDPAKYGLPVATEVRDVSFVRIVPPLGSDWDEARVERVPIHFAGGVTRGKVFSVDGLGRPRFVALGADGSAVPAPAANQDFIFDGAVGEWSRQLSDNPSNPELSWEYWNGTSWSTLAITLEETLHFKSTGDIRFTIPPDIKAGDWAGKTSFWIRARLIGGDYGREEVTTRTHTLPNRDTEQTFERSRKGISPPVVLSLGIGYAIETEVLPSHVVTLDSGSFRDRSEENRAPDLKVEAFIPLAESLRRLTGRAVTGRSLFLGVDGPLEGGPANVLFMIPRGASQDAAAPLRAEALVSDRFVPLTAQDETRALGETGLLTLAFPDPPTENELFGRELRWVRLEPQGTGAWSPTLDGVYLNAVWASATETLTRELLGSSEGEPNMTVEVARPPLLHDSLELRVKEPLGEEERKKLRAEDPDLVLSDVADLPGHWVLWKQRVDPGDEDATARVYALDETLGVIRFGDGRNGAIPPVGRDSIVAFSYKRTEPPAPGAVDVPANSIESRSQINLSTPLEGVEAAFSADHAAGGSPPEPAERVLRVGSAKLRHRGRAVSLRDLEDLAVASSPQIAQARALAGDGRVTLIVALAGAEPVPSEAQKRELARRLLAASPAVLGEDSLVVDGPRVRSLRLEVRVQVDKLEDAGAVGDGAEKRLREFFDTARGGRDGAGWPLGASPTEDDVAFALIEVPRLRGVTDPELFELRRRDKVEWPQSLAPNELARLAADGVRVEVDVE